jgi:penicillin-binding protein 2
VGQVRSYPLGEAAAHLLGYVGAVSEAELVEDDPLLAQPGFRTGKNGLEKRHDAVLRGTAGIRELEVNAVGRVVRELSRAEPVPGRPVTLTIDAKLQAYAQQRLASHVSASAVVMDVDTGAVLAAASHPSFDPNGFSTGISAELWDSLNQNEAAPLSNRVTQGHYPPGSTFKPVVALAALQSGLVSADHQVHCPGHFDLGDHRVYCVKKEGHGRLDMVGAMARSCDVYFWDVALKIGVDRIAAMARTLGFGQRTGIELAGERPGLMPDTAWKRRALKAPWYPGDTLNVGIGQGDVLATPLQLCVLAATLANGGRVVHPHLTGNVPPPAARPLFLDPEHLAVVMAGMRGVTTPGGTAYAARITQAGMEMAGKSGTAQVRRISAQQHAEGVVKGDKLPWKERDHALFIAYAPVQAPRYACCVVVEHGIGGSSVAAPIARDLLVECQMLAREVA